MPMGKSIRIYDLAREVKQDTKRVMEDVRREGADVSVASNSVSHEIAEKVRNKYFPKTEVAPKRTIKVIKAAAKKDDEPIVETETPVVEPIPEPEPEVEAKPAVTKKKVEVPPEKLPEEALPTPKVRKLSKKTIEEPIVEEEIERPQTVKRLTRTKVDVTEPETAPEIVSEAPPETEVESKERAEPQTPAVSP